MYPWYLLGPRSTNIPENEPEYSAIDSPLSPSPEEHALSDTPTTLDAPCGVPAANSNTFIVDDDAECTAYVVGFGHQNKFRFAKNNKIIITRGVLYKIQKADATRGCVISWKTQ